MHIIWISVNATNNKIKHHTLFKYFQLHNYGIDCIKKVRKRAFLWWNHKIQNVTVVSYIALFIFMDRTTPLVDTYREKMLHWYYWKCTIGYQKCAHMSFFCNSILSIIFPCNLYILNDGMPIIEYFQLYSHGQCLRF